MSSIQSFLKDNAILDEELSFMQMLFYVFGKYTLEPFAESVQDVIAEDVFRANETYGKLTSVKRYMS